MTETKSQFYRFIVSAEKGLTPVLNSDFWFRHTKYVGVVMGGQLETFVSSYYAIQSQ